MTVRCLPMLFLLLIASRNEAGPSGKETLRNVRITACRLKLKKIPGCFDASHGLSPQGLHRAFTVPSFVLHS